MTAYRSTIIAMGLLGALLTQAATADQDMRITQLQRCGDLFSKQALSWCLPEEKFSKEIPYRRRPRLEVKK